MLSLMIASTVIIAAIILFALWYGSSTLGTTAHRTAVESAALAAAADLGKICVNTPECGYVSLTGSGPIAQSAQDNWYQQVRSINEMLATNRLDMIIADQIGDPYMKQLAQQDHANILKAKDALVQALTDALKPGGSGYDISGNKITPYDDALTLYLENPQVKSNYVQGSMKITLGSIDGGVTTAQPVPNPVGKAFINSNQMVNGYYRSDMNLAYGGEDFVFGSVSAKPGLVDFHKFTTSASGLPYQIPAVVQVFAQQAFKDQNKQWTTDYTACATAGGLFRTPAPGAFLISFPDGTLPEITKPSDLMTNQGMKGADCNVYTSQGGDYPNERPQASLTQTLPWAPPPGQHTACNMYSQCLYDWLRHAGSSVNVDSIVTMQSTPLAQPAVPMIMWNSLDALLANVQIGMVPAGIMNIYEFNPDGTVQYKSKSCKPYPYMCVSNNQLYAETIKEFPSKSQMWGPYFIVANNKKEHIKPQQKWDVYYRDQVHQFGSGLGGKHVGEPIDDTTPSTLSYANRQNRLAWADDYGSGGIGAGGAGGGLPPMVSEETDFAISTTNPPPSYWTYQPCTSGGAPRPTYIKNGGDCEIRFRQKIDVHELGLYFGKTGYIGLML